MANEQHVQADRASLDQANDLPVALDGVVDQYSNLFRRTLTQVEGGERLTLPQYRCLQALAATGTALTTQLARQMEVAVPTMTGRIDGLVARGFVERHPDPIDRRQIRLVLTDVGRSHFEHCRRAAMHELQRLLSRLEAPQAERLSLALADLAQLLKDQAPADPAGTAEG